MTTQTTLNTFNFINALNRYIEVSFVYSQRISEERARLLENNTNDRLTRLIKLLESVEISPNPMATTAVDSSSAGGQNIIPSKAVFEQTRYYQHTIKERLGSLTYNSILPHNIEKLKRVLDLEPEVFLGSFKSISYAWDVLTEFASLSFLPSAEKLVARDIIHMHVVELRQHLSRILVMAKLLTPTCPIDISGRFTTSQLQKLQNEKKLVEKVIERSVNRNIEDLVKELRNCIDDNSTLVRELDFLETDAIARMNQEAIGYPDILEEEISINQAEAVCNSLVAYGLILSYSIWLFFAKNDEKENGILSKHCLFCTRTLLDEKRWFVCSKVAKISLEIINTINIQMSSDSKIGVNMLQTNLFFSRKMLGESVNDEVSAWDLRNAHLRYKFLQQILLNKFDDASQSANKLLTDKENGKPNMSITEFEEWPILEEFRGTEYWAKIKQKFKN